MMKFPARARYTLRLMVELVKRNALSKPVNLVQISEATGISRRYLEQLASALKTHSLVRGVSGRNGGYVLARKPTAITIGQILEAVLGPLETASCVDEPEICMSSEFCETRCFWVVLDHRISQVLGEFSLADLVSKEGVSRLRLMSAEAEELNGNGRQGDASSRGRDNVVNLSCRNSSQE